MLVTHDVYRFTIQVQGSNHIGIPIGFHVKLCIHGEQATKLRKCNISNPSRFVNLVFPFSDVSKSYTPISASLFSSNPLNETKNEQIQFLIKIYPKGEFTPLLHSVPLTSTEQNGTVNEKTNFNLQIGCSAGTFSLDFLEKVNTLLLIAGGTGLTPMIRIIDHFKDTGRTDCSVILMFFNHREQDIIWRQEFEELEKKYSWFRFHPILTSPDENWTGAKGKISKQLITDCLLGKDKSMSGPIANGQVGSCKKAIVCGSQGFNFACQRYVNKCIWSNS